MTDNCAANSEHFAAKFQNHDWSPQTIKKKKSRDCVWLTLFDLNTTLGMVYKLQRQYVYPWNDVKG